MFARYSRTTKSLRRLFLDEFAGDIDEIAGAHAGASSTAGSERAARLYDSVFVEYGDDSVAQLGGVHLACEQSSQLLAKALEWGRLAAYLEQSTRYMRYDDKPGGAWRATLAARARRHPGGRSVRGVPRRGVHDVRPHVRADGSVVHAALPEAGRRQRLRLPPDDHGEDVRHAAGAAARGNPLQPGHLRDRPVLRAAADAAGRAPARRDARGRRADEGRAAEGHPRVPEAGRRRGTRRRLVALLGREPRARRGAHRARAHRRRREARAPRRGDARRLRPRGRDEDRGRGAVRVVGDARRPAARARTLDAARAGRRDPARERRRPGEPSPQARPFLGTHELPLRRAVRLRGVPRPAAAPPAHDRVAAPDHRARLRDAVADRRGRTARAAGSA